MQLTTMTPTELYNYALTGLEIHRNTIQERIHRLKSLAGQNGMPAQWIDTIQTAATAAAARKKNDSGHATHREPVQRPAPGQYKRSAAQRRRMSDAQKRRWRIERRKAK